MSIERVICIVILVVLAVWLIRRAGGVSVIPFRKRKKPAPVSLQVSSCLAEFVSRCATCGATDVTIELDFTTGLSRLRCGHEPSIIATPVDA